MSWRDDVSTWEPSTVVMALFIAIVSVASLLITLGAHAWALARGVEGVSWNPLSLMIEVCTGRLDPTGEVYGWIGGVGGVLIVLVLTALVVALSRRSKRSRRGDEAAKWAGRGKDIEPITKAALAAKAKRLGVSGGLGFPVGRTVAGDMAVTYSCYAIMQVKSVFCEVFIL